MLPTGGERRGCAAPDASRQGECRRFEGGTLANLIGFINPYRAGADPQLIKRFPAARLQFRFARAAVPATDESL
jgi:hypothetical protein